MVKNEDFPLNSQLQSRQKNIGKPGDYWLKKLSGDWLRSTFHYDYKETISNVRIIGSVEFRFSGGIFTKLLRFCNGSDSGLYKILVTGLIVLLGKYTHTPTGSNDIMVGTPILFEQRRNIDAKPINTALVLRCQYEEDIAFKEMYAQVGSTIDEANENKDFPVEDLPKLLNMQVFGDDFPIFDVVISLENIQDKRYLHHLNANMIFSFFRTGKYIDGVVEYNSCLYEKSTIKKIINNFTHLLESALSDVHKPLYKIDMFSREEKKELLEDLNDTKVSYPEDKTIQEIIELQVEKNPDNIALVFQDQQLTYRGFNGRSNQLGRLLRDKGMKPDQFAGLMVERSLEMLIAMLAILKAGGAYLPIDPDYPQDRIGYLLEDSNSKLLLTREELVNIVDFDGEVISLDVESMNNEETQNLQPVNTSRDLAYAIYTSGSTGKPKGVMIEHWSVINLAFSQKETFNIQETDKILQFSSISFDASVEQIYITLFSGAALVLIDKTTLLDIKKFETFIDVQSLAHIHAVPLFVGSIPVKKYSGLKRMIAGGDACPQSLMEKWISCCDFCNEYGPTETTVTSIQLLVKKGVDLKGLSIGRPLNNTLIYILGKYMELVPRGVPGELCIGGDGVARGYMNRPGLTSEKFVPNSFVEDGQNQRMYKTGDLARWLPDGSIDFLGRIDFQVKIRGFRIETGEIENQILTQQDQKIKEAVVIAREYSGGEKYLCAYIAADKTIDITVLINTLSKNLPEYMIPAHFVQIDEIPLIQSGKVNRKALPDPKQKAREKDYIGPRNEIEKKLVEIWSELLQMEKNLISIDDNFFRLGGHSLKAAVMITAIHKEFNVKVAIYQVFEMSTIRKLGLYIKEANREEYLSIPLAEKKEYYPQTSAQRRLYFIDQLGKGNILYNMQMMDVYCKGIEKERLEEAFRKLIYRHESLRTSFFTLDGEAVQRVHEYEAVGSTFAIEYWETAEDGMISSNEKGKEWTKWTGIPFQDVVEQFVRPFDLGKAPILRVGLIKIWGRFQILMIDMHHIMSDGVSEVLFIKDLWAVFEGEELPELRTQYKDFSQWFSGEERKREIEKQERYWLNQFVGEIPILNLPTDYPRPARMTFEGDTSYFELDKEETKRLNTLAHEQGITLYMILFAVYNVLLAKLSGQEDIVVGTVTAGRGHADLQQIIGMFVDTLAVRNYPAGNKTFNELLAEVKINTLKAFENQDYPFEQLASKVAQRKDTSRNPLFDVVFSLENEAERTDQYLLDVLMLYKSSPFKFEVKKSKFDMILYAIEKGEEMEFNLEYNTKLFKEETIDRFVIYFKKIVASVCRNSEQKIAEIEIIPDLERGLLLYSFNDESEYPKNKTIHLLFEEQVARNPDNKAVIGKAHGPWGAQLTYRELNVKANQLAGLLRTRGIESDSIAAVMVEPCQEMMIALIGILKAGGAFLPLKAGTPKDRTEYILQESGTRFFLTRKELMEGITFKGEIIQLDDSRVYIGDNTNPTHVNKSRDLAYVIYTSGSTGKPKGVMVSHRSLVNLCFWHNRYYSVTSNDRATKYAGFGFDASVWEVFPYLIIGAALYIVPEEIKLDIHGLNHYFENNGITISFLPTQLCEQFMTIENNSLRVLLTGGDKLKSFIKKNYHLYNNYGPTENTVVATGFLVTELTTNIPIGKPVDNNQIYIMDNNDKLQPIGVPGELCIGGDSLARGYINNPELTEEKFIESPFKHLTPWTQYPKVYRTGDLARWLPVKHDRWLIEGKAEFLGRIDYQVKVRGFRIELGEIENQLLHIEDIKEAVVIAREDTPGQKYLCAYIVSNKAVDVESLKHVLAKKLPDYMIPSFFVQIEQIPLNPNGKIDTKALPAPETIGAAEYVAPRNETEKIMSQIWSNVLGEEKIGIDDNFFEIGGDSIKTILISAKLQKQHNLIVNVNDFFIYPTIRKLVKHLETLEHIPEEETISRDEQLIAVDIEKDFQKYLERIQQEKEKWPDFSVTNDYKHILLTGPGGYLGAHLTYELLKQISPTIHLLIRTKRLEQLLRELLSELLSKLRKKILTGEEPVLNEEADIKELLSELLKKILTEKELELMIDELMEEKKELIDDLLEVEKDKRDGKESPRERLEKKLKKDLKNYCKNLLNEALENYCKKVLNEEADRKELLQNLIKVMNELKDELKKVLEENLEKVLNEEAYIKELFRDFFQNLIKERFRERFNLYFAKDGEDKFAEYEKKDRVKFYPTSDLSYENLGMWRKPKKYEKEYENLCKEMKGGAVVHSAANVKHFGKYEEFYKDNVQSTEKLLEFAAAGKKIDFHFISTLDTGRGEIPGKDYLLFTEYCHDEGQKIDEVYLKSKLEAEKRVLAYREKGLNAFIYRAANMTFHSETGKFQKNIEANFFYSMLKALIKIGFWSNNMLEMKFDLSFVNKAASAIVLLMTRKQLGNLENKTYHICNPNFLSWKDMTVLLNKANVKFNYMVKDPPEVLKNLDQYEGKPEYEEIIERVKVYSWEWEGKEKTRTVPKIDRTVMLLKKLGFEWPTVTEDHIKKMIAHCDSQEVDFFKNRSKIK